MERAQILARERAQVGVLLDAVRDDPADRLVRLAERHALAHERLGEIGGEQHRVARGLAHARLVHAQRGDRAGHHLERVAQRARRVEDRLLVFLEIAVVGERQALQHREQRHEVADRAARLAAHELGHVGVLLLRHQARAGRVGVGELDERRTPRSTRARAPRRAARGAPARSRPRRGTRARRRARPPRPCCCATAPRSRARARWRRGRAAASCPRALPSRAARARGGPRGRGSAAHRGRTSRRTRASGGRAAPAARAGDGCSPAAPCRGARARARAGPTAARAGPRARRARRRAGRARGRSRPGRCGCARCAGARRRRRSRSRSRASTFMWMSSSDASNGNRPDSISSPISASPRRSAARSSAESSPTLPSISAWASREPQVVARERAVEVDRRREALDGRIGVLPEAPPPGLVAFARHGPNLGDTASGRKLRCARRRQGGRRVASRGRAEGERSRGRRAAAKRCARRRGAGRGARSPGPCWVWRSRCGFTRRRCSWSRSTTRCASASREPSSGFPPGCTARLPSYIRDSTGGASASRRRSRGSAIARPLRARICPRGSTSGRDRGCACTCARSSTRPAPSPTATSRSALRGHVDQRHPRDSGRRLGRRRAARARAARRLLRARARAARAGAAGRRAAAPRRRGARGRGPALRDPLGDRLPPDRGRDAREPARGEDQAGRQHAHPAARQELLPDARAQVAAQAARSVHGADRGGPI